MNITLIVVGGVLLAAAGVLFVYMQLPKEQNQKAESLLSLVILISGAAGFMTLISGIYP